MFPVARIDPHALRHNLAAVRRYAPGARVLAAVKANAYGHGLVLAARALAEADALGVARLDEALELREAGIDRPIVLLEGVFSGEQLDVAAHHSLEIVVHTFEQIAMLESFAGAHRFAVWLKVDTGMNRLGLKAEAFEPALARLQACRAVGTLRVMSHLASAERLDEPTTRQQIERFNALTSKLGLERSLANSAGLIAWPQARLEWVRPGLMLYGISPFASGDAAALGLDPAMTLTTRVIAVRDLEAGECVGYGGIWCAAKPSRIAVAAIGYGDGYPRCMRSGAPVLVNGAEAVVAGRVSMDMMTIDVTHLPAVTVGDAVTLWGEGLPVERVAPFADTIAYELVCRVMRVAKVEEAG